jgi:uncharacterized SAM-binding protein YcdF (DUF218 family)
MKKLVQPFLQPLPLCLALAAAGLVFLWFTRRQKLGKVLATSGLGLLIVLSFPAVSDRLVRPLEYAYLPVASAAVATERDKRARDAKWIVVLGGGHREDLRMSPEDLVSLAALPRVIEGLRLHRELPGTRLVFTGGNGNYAGFSDARAGGDLARALGIPSEEVILEAGPRDTEEEALVIKQRVGRDAFFLVTSATHMPRALGLFRKQGLDPMPAPTEHLTMRGENLSLFRLVPNAPSLANLDRAVHEYLGIAWSKLRGRI